MNITVLADISQTLEEKLIFCYFFFFVYLWLVYKIMLCIVVLLVCNKIQKHHPLLIACFNKLVKI